MKFNAFKWDAGISGLRGQRFQNIAFFLDFSFLALCLSLIT